MKKQERSRSSDIKRSASIIKKGGIVVYPTDTVFGIGCRWDNKKSIEKIYEIKSRPKNLPMPILLGSENQLNELAHVTSLAQNLIKRYWPGALTVIVKSKFSGKKVGFRIPDNHLTRELINLSFPIIGTSANFHGNPPVKNSKDLDKALVKLVDFVIEGECEGGIESTVVDATGKKPIVVRQGALKVWSLTLTIDTTDRQQVFVSLFDAWSKLKDKLTVEQTGSQALIPSIVKILQKNRCGVKDITNVRINVGPGSFTGTRIGVSVANALGFALDIPVNGKLGKIAIPVYEKSKFD